MFSLRRRQGESAILVMILVTSTVSGCQDIPAVTFKNSLRESRCKLRENSTKVDAFKAYVFTKHGARTDARASRVMVPGYVSCTTTCPEDSLPTGNFTWCINIASLDDDVETCIRLGEGQVPYTNSTCEAELVGIPIPSPFPQ
jgi:hypothetical protein